MSDIGSEEYWADKDGVRLFVYRKRLGAPARQNDQRPVVFLVHGSTFSSQSAFDLTVPGHDDYSLMNRLASKGYDVWTMDHEGYGRSDRTDSNSDIASGADDLRAAVDVVAQETGLSQFSFYGQSSGALRVGVFAQRYPTWIDKLILDAFPWTGEGAPTLIKRREKIDYYRTHNLRPVDRPFFHSIFSRDKPGTSDPAVGDVIADNELQYGDTVPTGTYLDMCANLPVLDPTEIDCPTLVLRGEHDGVATEEDVLAFFSALPNSDKQLAIMAGMAHVAPLGLNRHRFWHLLESYLATPTRVDT
jgi:pimeloyl-ACP methyl ester carboxylesterase